MRVRRVIGGLLAIGALAVGCTDDPARSDGGLGAGPSDVDPLPSTEPGAVDPAVVATDLAPSQISGSTVPNPVTPVPCAIDDLEFWTARVVSEPPTVDAVIRVENVGDVRCDADIGRSEHLDPAIEFDVWLDRGGTADLVVGQRAEPCAEPTVVTSVEVAVGDAVVAVPTAVVTCEWWFTAFFPNQPVGNGCERGQLDLAVTSTALLVRNGSPSPCGLAGIVEVDGGVVARERPSGPSIRDLYPGDVVAFGRRWAAGCGGTTGTVELFDEIVRELRFDDVPCDLIFDLGGGRPWFDTADLPPDTRFGLEAGVAALNPFDDPP